MRKERSTAQMRPVERRETADGFASVRTESPNHEISLISLVTRRRSSFLSRAVMQQLAKVFVDPSCETFLWSAICWILIIFGRPLESEYFQIESVFL